MEPPIMMMHRWSRPPVSCKHCREKKRRCDRNQPCSSSMQRDIQCEYVGQGQLDLMPGDQESREATSIVQNAEEILDRLHKLEEAVFNNPRQKSFTPFRSHGATLMEQIYQVILQDKDPGIAELLLPLSIFAGSMLAWTPEHLHKLNATSSEAKAAFTAIPLSHDISLSLMIPNSDGYPLKIHLIRYRCHLMARAMVKGYNPIKVEARRWVWWNMMASDRLNSFPGDPQEEAYTFQPKHMMVEYPGNIDNESITLTGVLRDSPLYDSSFMSAFLYRVTFLDELPVFFLLDIPLQRISLHIRLCWLHRPYHLEACVQSTQKVLELRRLMDNGGLEVVLRPARLWMVMQHVFLAALILATDVSFDPNAPYAEARQTKAFAAHQILEKSKGESSMLVEAIRKNMQTLMSTLHKQQPQALESRSEDDLSNTWNAQGLDDSCLANHTVAQEPTSTGDGLSSSNVPHERSIEEEDWDQLWLNFPVVAPALHVPQWNFLLDDIDVNFSSDT
ncbi:hypothetical protein BDV28DRAFT_155208 [Aspergillus coremiiformis]|uniref:Zn(2)-C6 fungal-type domain-containing protein n=1 Tax=Aspergillus coremiiformis TaxID=138285 RepID=A0A5N6ZDW9_9EURO|nr:hypothetical protein BDV28DRAFT_155208 [Aspergillus coremiiformis]